MDNLVIQQTVRDGPYMDVTTCETVSFDRGVDGGKLHVNYRTQTGSGSFHMGIVTVKTLTGHVVCVFDVDRQEIRYL